MSSHKHLEQIKLLTALTPEYTIVDVFHVACPIISRIQSSPPRLLLLLQNKISCCIRWVKLMHNIFQLIIWHFEADTHIKNIDKITHILQDVVRCKYFEADVHIKNPIKNSYQDGLGTTPQTLDHVVVVHILI